MSENDKLCLTLIGKALVFIDMRVEWEMLKCREAGWMVACCRQFFKAKDKGQVSVNNYADLRVV